jgi:hypothetical protein
MKYLAARAALAAPALSCCGSSPHVPKTMPSSHAPAGPASDTRVQKDLRADFSGLPGVVANVSCVHSNGNDFNCSWLYDPNLTESATEVDDGLHLAVTSPAGGDVTN